MDLHSHAPSPSASVSSDNGYALADDEPSPPPAPPATLTLTAAPAPASPPAPAVPPAAPVAAAPPSAPAAPATAPAPATAAVTPATPGPEPATTPEATGEAAKKPAEARSVALRRKKRKVSARHLVPAWVVSMLVHTAILAALAAFTFSAEVKKLIPQLNTALVPGPKDGQAEETPIYADPASQRSESAIGSETATAGGGSSGGGGGGIGGIGSGPPSATPVVSGVGNGVGEKTSLPGIKVTANISNLSLMPAAPGLDLGGGGLIGGDVTYGVSDVGQSLDQIAREILRHLSQHKLTVVWMFDESGSMKDDQQAIKQKFDRIVSELKSHADPEKKVNEPLTHAIVGFGQEIHFEQAQPTADIERIGKAIDRLKVDDTGVENTLHAINAVVDHYGGLIRKDRRLLIVLVTDESGDDGDYIEEAHQAVVGRKVPIYVIGRQSLFGYSDMHLAYVDPVTKDTYWPAIRRGPESADIEMLQWDGLHERREEQPSGFAPYELARLAKDTGGIYFLLPSEEKLRVRDREQAYRIADLKEYVPDYGHRLAYASARQKSDFRRSLYNIILKTRNWGFQTHFPVDPVQLSQKATEAGLLANRRVEELVEIQQELESLKKLRDREPEKRWQAHYDLMLGQIVAYQIKAYEYGACLAEMVKTQPRPKEMPTAERVVEWVLGHTTQRKAPKERTEKKYQEAMALLKDVIAKHPKTPWADLAKNEIDRGFGVHWGEWHHNPKYDERQRLVPKY